jgi:hypothetical protein
MYQVRLRRALIAIAFVFEETCLADFFQLLASRWTVTEILHSRRDSTGSNQVYIVQKSTQCMRM